MIADSDSNSNIFTCSDQSPWSASNIAYGLEEIPEEISIQGADLITVNTFDDVVMADDGLISLREAIDSANNSSDDTIILLSEGTYALTIANPVDGELSSDPNSTGDLDILGVEGKVFIAGVGDSEDILINAQNLGDRVFEIQESVDVMIANLTITGGYTDFGGGIYNSGTLSVIESSFEGNSASGSRSGLYAFSRYGGGIYNTGILKVSESSFEGNSSAGFGSEAGVIGSGYGYGGGIYNSGTLSVSKSSFEGNSAAGFGSEAGVIGSSIGESGYGYGGGIYNSGTLKVSKNSFEDNTATGTGFGYGYGGAIYNQGILTVADSEFEENSANRGGAIFNAISDDYYGLSIGNVIVTDSDFEENTAVEDGGAIYNQGNLTVIDSDFEENSANRGGAIFNELDGVLTLIGINEFENNVPDDIFSVPA